MTCGACHAVAVLTARPRWHPTAQVAACELLHSLVVYMVGAQDKAGRARRQEGGASFVKLYEHIFPALLRCVAGHVSLGLVSHSATDSQFV